MFEKVTAFIDSFGFLYKTKEQLIDSERRKILDKYICHENYSCVGYSGFGREHAITDFIKHYNNIKKDFEELDKKGLEV